MEIARLFWRRCWNAGFLSSVLSRCLTRARNLHSAEITHFASRGQIVKLFSIFDKPGEKADIEWLLLMWQHAMTDQEKAAAQRRQADRWNMR